MTLTTLRLAALSTLAALSLAGTASAYQVNAVSIANGTCKSNFIVAIAPSSHAATAAWSSITAGAYGHKWSIWVGAKNKSVLPYQTNSGLMYRALAQPCFYQPVM